MRLWLDAHLSPRLALWISGTFPITFIPLRNFDLQTAADRDIFEAARRADASLMTKDVDFADLVQRLGPPPHIILLTFGNTSESYLRSLLATRLQIAIEMIAHGAPLVEIG